MSMRLADLLRDVMAVDARLDRDIHELSLDSKTIVPGAAFVALRGTQRHGIEFAAQAIARGAAMVTENLFEARFRFVNEMVRLGADVRTDGHHAFVRGKERLSGAPVEAADIRAGAGLVLAGLVADGVTTVYEPHHVDRGYEGFIDDLVRLGADVSRVQVNQLA